jgi:peptide/nickel transport system ATP-binding protein
MDMTNTSTELLEVDGLSVDFRTRSGTVHALDKVCLSIATGETVGLVGESGSGKSVLSFAIMGIQDAAARISVGSLHFAGQDLLADHGKAMQTLRGRDLAMIFQNPRVALNPIRQVGRQIADVISRHSGLHAAACRERALQCLSEVRIPDPERRYDAYPFELSGGMCQRVMIAIALACKPRLLIADEPTTGLDVTTQAAIMLLIHDLSSERQMSTLLITHDLSLARAYCDRIVVMHAGHIVEVAPSAELFANPLHPYSERLIAATPHGAAALSSLASIQGNLPDLRRDDLPACRFAERCSRYATSCEAPLELQPISATHRVACHQPLECSATVRLETEHATPA